MPAFYTIATFSLVSEAGTSWTGTIKQYLNSDPGSSTVEISRRAELVYGDPLGREVRPILESFLELEFDDPDDVIKDALDSANSDQDIRLELRRGSTYAWDGFAARGTRQDRRYGDAGTVSVRFYCGLVTAHDFQYNPAVDWARMDGVFRDGVMNRIRDWTIKYYLAWRPHSWRLDTPSAGALPFDTRLYLGRMLLAADLMVQILTDWVARMFQPLTIDDEWRIQQFLTTGQQITTGSNFGSYDPAGGASHAFNITGNEPADVVALTTDDVDYEAVNLKLIGKRAEQVELIAPDGITEFRMERDGDFEHWLNATTPAFWESDNVVQESTDVHQGSHACEITSGTPGDGYIRQRLAMVTEGDIAQPHIRFYARADTGSTTPQLRFRIDPLNPGDDTYYSTSGGAWSTSDAYVNASSVNTSYSLRSLTMVEPIPVTGTLWVEFRNGVVTYLVDAIEVVSRAADLTTPAPPLMTIGEVANDAFSPTTVQARERPYYEQGNNSDTNIILVDDGNGSFWPVTKWKDEDDTIYSFLHELAALKRLEMLAGEAFIGTVDAIIPPERAFTLSGKTYAAPSGMSIDLVAEKTRAFWLEKVHELP